MKKMVSQITNLAITCSVHPSSKRPLPFGSQILSHIYREIMRLTEKDFIMVSVFILKRCCHVFFKHLEHWIFNGILEDVADELFICYVSHHRPYTKYFFDKAYFIRKDSVPGFLQGHETDILQCGKYTMLLKALKPNHPIFNITHPSLKVSLSFNDLEKVENECKDYYEKCREICGKPIYIFELYQDQTIRKKEFIRSISEKSKENMKRWNAEQEVLASIQAEIRKKQFEDLSNQLRENKMQKIADRQANIAAELKILREAEKKNDSILLIDNLNLQKRIEYYQEMNDVLSKKLGLPISNVPEIKVDIEGENTPSVYNECISVDSDFDRNANLNDVDRNRKHIMSSSNIKDIMCDGDTGKEDSLNANMNLVLEAQRIKKKIMDQEQNIDVNLNPLKTELSELEKNRNKMMSSNTFACVNLPKERPNLTLDLTTERARNKRKVLESEFDIIPMSTTSDVSVLEKFSTKTEEIQEKSSQEESEKVASSDEKESLATEETFSRMQMKVLVKLI
uniref:Gamma-tubulin complex component n=1 Tax=Megaselia scalaris TaxID=36166 RepID=T1GS42_MEGSC